MSGCFPLAALFSTNLINLFSILFHFILLIDGLSGTVKCAKSVIKRTKQTAFAINLQKIYRKKRIEFIFFLAKASSSIVIKAAIINYRSNNDFLLLLLNSTSCRVYWVTIRRLLITGQWPNGLDDCV